MSLIRECKRCGVNFALRSIVDERRLCVECSPPKGANRYSAHGVKKANFETRIEHVEKEILELKEQLTRMVDEKYEELFSKLVDNLEKQIEQEMEIVSNVKIVTLNTRIKRLSDKIKMVKDENKIIRRRLKKLEGDK